MLNSANKENKETEVNSIQETGSISSLLASLSNVNSSYEQKQQKSITSTSFDELSLNSLDITERKIGLIRHKRGRTPKETSQRKRKCHNKFSLDNIRNKIQCTFINLFCICFLNKLKRKLLPDCLGEFQKEDNDISSHHKIQDMKKMLKLPLIQFFYTKQDKRRNNQIIEYICEKAKYDHYVKKMFFISYEDAFTHLFIKRNNIIGPELDDILKELPSVTECFLKKKIKDDFYYEKLTDISINKFINHFKNKKERQENTKRPQWYEKFLKPLPKI